MVFSFISYALLGESIRQERPDCLLESAVIYNVRQLSPAINFRCTDQHRRIEFPTRRCFPSSEAGIEVFTAKR